MRLDKEAIMAFFREYISVSVSSFYNFCYGSMNVKKN